MNTDVRVVEAQVRFLDEKPRLPLKFGKVVMYAATYADVTVTVETRCGKRGTGRGGIFLSDVWAFPTFAVQHDQKDKAMRENCEVLARKWLEIKDYRHPVELYLEVEPAIKSVCADITAKYAFPEPYPLLGSLVCTSITDGAVHDAFGIANGICSYDGYGKEYMKDMGHFLGPEFAGKYVGDCLRKDYEKRIPVFHLVGGLDKLREKEITDSDPKDGLPVSLEKWIETEQLFCLKVKLRGLDLPWDIDRTIEVANVARSVYKRLGIKKEFVLSVDTNEVCESPQYIVDLLTGIKAKDADAHGRILYVEQPTGRDLSEGKAGFDMSGIGRMKPVLVDESLTGIKEFFRARELHWTGLALKTCKCHSAELLMVALAEHYQMPYTVQDLTNPKLSLVHSAGFAARIHPMQGVEANSAQFFPASSAAEAKVHPGIFSRKGGYLDLSSLGKLGLGFRAEEIR